MRFDPKLIHPEEPPLDAAGELELPADLAALGEQLRDDAVHLAARYPAEREAVLRECAVPSRAWDRGLAFRTIAIFGSSLAAALVAIVLWQGLPGPPAQNRTAAVSVPTTIVSPSPRPAIAPIMNTVAPVANNGVSLADLSGPELEALVDLLARDPERAGSISF